MLLAAAEIIALRKHIEKLKLRNYIVEQKICRNCRKDYSEKENFNWSCRTHQSTFGGEIWWCCGRKNKEDPGCKYSRHEPKDDENPQNRGGAKAQRFAADGLLKKGFDSLFNNEAESKKEDTVKCLVSIE